MDAPRRCPRCISDEVIRNLYGTPSPELLEEARSGRVALGAVMCFGPKHRSGCALHVSTSGPKKWRHGDLSRKAHESAFHIFCSFHLLPTIHERMSSVLEKLTYLANRVRLLGRAAAPPRCA